MSEGIDRFVDAHRDATTRIIEDRYGDIGKASEEEAQEAQREREREVTLFSRLIAESFSDVSKKAQNILFYEMMEFLHGALEEFDTRIGEGHYDYLFDDEDGGE